MGGGLTVIGIGNRFRHDDAAGLEVARRVRRRVDGDVRIVELEGEPIDALDVWTAADEVIVADAVADAGAAGTVHLLDASDAPIPAPFRAKGTPRSASRTSWSWLGPPNGSRARSSCMGSRAATSRPARGSRSRWRGRSRTRRPSSPTSGDALMCLGAIGVIREVFEENGLPMARVEGDVRAPEVCLLYVPAARSGDHVLVELGFAVEALEPEEAAEALRLRGASAGRDEEAHEGH